MSPNRGFNSFTDNMIKLSGTAVTKQNWTSLFDRTHALVLQILSRIFDFAPEKLQGMLSIPRLRVIQKRCDLLVAFPLYIDIKERQMITLRHRKFLPRCITFLFSSFWAEKYGWHWQHGYYSLQNKTTNIQWDDEVVKRRESYKTWPVCRGPAIPSGEGRERLFLGKSCYVPHITLVLSIDTIITKLCACEDRWTLRMRMKVYKF